MKRFRNILYFADGALEAGPALERAVALAESNNARLTVMDVIEHQDSTKIMEDQLGADLNEVLREYRRQALEELVDPFNESDTVIYTQVLTGTPFMEVIRYVMTGGFDLVVKAAHTADGITKRLLGSTDMHLMRKCPCPVWIDRPAAALPYKRILAAVDPESGDNAECAKLIMDLSQSLAEQESAELMVVHAWRLYGESMLLNGRGQISELDLTQVVEHRHRKHQKMLNELLEPYGMSTKDASVHLVKGDPAPTLYALAEQLDVDLVVMGTVGRTGIPGFLIGNTAEEVLQSTKASVLAIKPEGFNSPVTIPSVA